MKRGMGRDVLVLGGGMGQREREREVLVGLWREEDREGGDVGEGRGVRAMLVT